MFMHNKRLMHTVRVAEPNPKLASLMLEQFGGPQGELAAAMRYFSQALAESDPGRKDLLYDIATEELSHLEVIGSIVVMLNKGVKGKLAEGVGDGELLAEITQGGESHTTSLLFGGGAALINSGGASPGRPLMSTPSASRPPICAPTSPPRRGPRSSMSG
jgi:Mn-containing catalase